MGKVWKVKVDEKNYEIKLKESDLQKPLEFVSEQGNYFR